MEGIDSSTVKWVREREGRGESEYVSLGMNMEMKMKKGIVLYLTRVQIETRFYVCFIIVVILTWMYSER